MFEPGMPESLYRPPDLADLIRIEIALRYDHSALAGMKKAMEALESKVGK
jgi:hypothetical protein